MNLKGKIKMIIQKITSIKNFFQIKIRLFSISYLWEILTFFKYAKFLICKKTLFIQNKRFLLESVFC